MHAMHVVGVDPGLVHTGAVRMGFVPADRTVTISSAAIEGYGKETTEVAAEVKDWVLEDATAVPLPDPSVYIEAYRPRSHFGGDSTMIQLVQDLRRELDAAVLQNTGVKQVVKRPLMELLGIWKFSTVTHHQDLRSAGRIGLLGMLKTPHGNEILTEIVRAHLRGEPWDVHH